MKTNTLSFCALLIARACYADTPVQSMDIIKPLTIVGASGSLTQTDLTDSIDPKNASIASLAAGQMLVSRAFAAAGVATSPRKTSPVSCSCVVLWGADMGAPGKLPLIAKSNWYVYNPGANWKDADFLANKRIFGVDKPFVLIVHLNAPVSPPDYQLAYTFTATHRTAANVQHLQSAIGLFGNLTALAGGGASNAPPPNYWALGSIEANPPSDVVISAAITYQGVTVNLDSVDAQVQRRGGSTTGTLASAFQFSHTKRSKT